MRESEGKYILRLLNISLSHKTVFSDGIYEEIRRLPEYVVWRRKVLEKDNWTCRNCHRKDFELAVHHIKPLSLIVTENKIKNELGAKKCKELFNVENGTTLCRRCHKKFHFMLQTLKYSGKSLMEIKREAI